MTTTLKQPAILKLQHPIVHSPLRYPIVPPSRPRSVDIAVNSLFTAHALNLTLGVQWIIALLLKNAVLTLLYFSPKEN